jgi:hypothetical protein
VSCYSGCYFSASNLRALGHQVIDLIGGRTQFGFPASPILIVVAVKPRKPPSSIWRADISRVPKQYRRGVAVAEQAEAVEALLDDFIDRLCKLNLCIGEFEHLDEIMRSVLTEQTRLKELREGYTCPVSEES